MEKQKKVKFADVSTADGWDEYIYQEAYIGNPETFRHKDQWQDAEEFVIENCLSQAEQERLDTEIDNNWER